MICFPNAKVNLGLHILSRRTDGYHNIETVFYPLPLCDALEVVEATAFSFAATGLAVDATTEGNLAVRAMRLLSGYGLPPLEVHLHKAIPSGAGLGGGSADAAFMLRLLNDFGQLGLSEEKLEAMAGTLGADCPFFIRNRPVFATGTGNHFESLPLSLKGYHYAIVKPRLSVSTAAAYASVQLPPLHQPRPSLKEIIQQPVASWREALHNDFETSIFSQYPSIAAIKESLYASGALYATMSGSGSSVFALFQDTAPSLSFPTAEALVQGVL